MENEQVYHLSFGSATTGVHVSTDIPVDDPALNRKSDEFLDYAMRMGVVATRLQNTLKGK